MAKGAGAARGPFQPLRALHDCLDRRTWYRYCVSISPRTWRGLTKVALPVLALGLASVLVPFRAKAEPASEVSQAAIVPTPVLLAPVAQAWWRRSGDAVLTGLVEQGLFADHDLTCRLSALKERDRTAAKRDLGASLKRLFAAKDAIASAQAARAADVERIAGGREARARDIALAYLDLRRLQHLHALRAAVIDQYKDNAEIAEFRRQAGLASAIDSALASVQDETARAELGYIDGRLPDALARLAQLTGLAPQELAARVGESGPLPPGLLEGQGAQADNGREAALAEALEKARRTARDVRAAYREGAATIATLYVAEAAQLSAEQALEDTRAIRAEATVNSWSIADRAWARGDIEPATTASGPGEPADPLRVAACG